MSSLRDFWQQMPVGKKILLIGGLLVVIAVSATLVWYARAPRYTQLYGNLTEEDANAVVEQLKEMKVPYHLQGSNISVPEQSVDEVRLSLAGQGLPRGGNVGFELFDKTQFGLSEFDQRIKYLRAMQGELARTISQLQCVRAARVHLALPERRLFQTDDQPATAAVVLELRGSAPTPSETRAIIHLVSSAVEGLKPADVTIVDTMGNLLSQTAEAAENSDITNKLRMQRSVEMQIEERIQTMLDRVWGPNTAIVRASVKLDYDRRQVDQEVYTPANGTEAQGVLESQHQTIETYGGAKPRMGVGVAGVATNVMSPSASGGGTGTNSYSREDSTAQYRVSRSVEHIEVTPGKVAGINLALLVDDTIPTSDVTQLSKTIAAAAGIDEKRGDHIEVQLVNFATASAGSPATAPAKATSPFARYLKYGQYGLYGLLGLAVLLVLRALLRRPRAAARHPLTYDAVHISEESSVMSDEERALEQIHNPAISYADPNEVLEPGEVPVADLDPQRIAQVIKGLLAEDLG